MRAGERRTRGVRLAGELCATGGAHAVSAVRADHRCLGGASHAQDQEHGGEEAREEPETVSVSEHS